MMTITDRRFFLASLTAGITARLLGQQTAASSSQPYVPKQSDQPQPIEGDEPGFQSIFDGSTLRGWEGDPKYWRVSDGAMVGEITPETIIKSNTFIIWRGGSPEDFELKVEYRITVRRQQRHKLSKRSGPRQSDPGESIRHARISMRY